MKGNFIETHDEHNTSSYSVCSTFVHSERDSFKESIIDTPGFHEKLSVSSFEQTSNSGVVEQGQVA